VDPSPTKGLVSIVPADDGLLHFYWANRENNNVEEDLILFPGDASFVPVDEAQGGRTYVLKFASSDKRLFFWMQDLDASKDSENALKINNALTAMEGDEEMEATSDPVPEEPLSSAVPPATASAPAPGSTAPTPEQVAQLRALLRSVGTSAGAQRSGLGFLEPELSLGDVLTPSNLQPLFDNPELLRTVFPSLPTDLPVPPSASTVRRIVESPPFQASVRQLDQALATGMLQGLVVSLGLPPEAGSGVGAFLRAIGEQAKRNPPPSGNNDGMDTA